MGFLNALKLLWSDWLLPLLESLPKALKDAGEGIEAAGENVVKASYFIKGGGNVPVNARETVALTADVIEDCDQIIKNAAQLIKTAGEEIDKIKVPTVTASYTTVVGVSVVSGLQFGETSLFGNVASNLKNGANNLNNVAAKLHTASNNLNNLRDALNETGGDLYTVGMKLKESGEALKRLAGNQ